MEMQAIIARITSFFMAVLALFGVLSPAAPTDGDWPTSVVVDGSTVDYALYTNPSTGYGWTASIDGDCAVIEREYSVAENTNPSVAGAGGMHHYVIKAVRPGIARATFNYRRSWETTPYDKTIVVLITVLPGGRIKLRQIG